MVHSSSDTHFDHAVKLSIEGLKALFLLNGGAVTALVALTDKTQGGSDYSVPIMWFGFATLLTVAAFALGYQSQLTYANHRFHYENGDVEQSEHYKIRHKFYQNFTRFVVVISLSFSTVAIILAYGRANSASTQHQRFNCMNADTPTEPTAHVRSPDEQQKPSQTPNVSVPSSAPATSKGNSKGSFTPLPGA